MMYLFAKYALVAAIVVLLLLDCPGRGAPTPPPSPATPLPRDPGQESAARVRFAPEGVVVDVPEQDDGPRFSRRTTYDYETWTYPQTFVRVLDTDGDLTNNDLIEFSTV